jgi:hypothetical protein
MLAHIVHRVKALLWWLALLRMRARFRPTNEVVGHVSARRCSANSSRRWERPVRRETACDTL